MYRVNWFTIELVFADSFGRKLGRNYVLTLNVCVRMNV